MLTAFRGRLQNNSLFRSKTRGYIETLTDVKQVRNTTINKNDVLVEK